MVDAYLLSFKLVAMVVCWLILVSQRLLRPSGAFGRLALVILDGIAGTAGLQSGTVIMASHTPEGPLIYRARPLAPGTYLVTSGGASINAHTALLDPAHPQHAGFSGSGYGIDLNAVNDWELCASGIMPEDTADGLIFGTPVLAPYAGQVVLTEGCRPDMAVPQQDEGHRAGDRVLVRGSDHDILPAHFRNGSLKAVVGDDLARGQQIVKVGNSGESSEPHPHIHAQMPGPPDSQFGGVPVQMRLEDKFLVQCDLVLVWVTDQ